MRLPLHSPKPNSALPSQSRSSSSHTYKPNFKISLLFFSLACPARAPVRKGKLGRKQTFVVYFHTAEEVYFVICTSSASCSCYLTPRTEQQQPQQPPSHIATLWLKNLKTSQMPHAKFPHLSPAHHQHPQIPHTDNSNTQLPFSLCFAS